MVILFSLFCSDPIFHNCYRQRNSFAGNNDEYYYLLYPVGSESISWSWGFPSTSTIHVNETTKFNSLVHKYSKKKMISEPAEQKILSTKKTRKLSLHKENSINSLKKSKKVEKFWVNIFRFISYISLSLVFILKKFKLKFSFF